MVSIARHGRLQRISRLAIFLTGMSTLIIGGIMTLSSFHQQQQEAEIRINQNLKTQAQILVDQFYSVTENLKNGADITQVPYVTNRAVIKLNSDGNFEVESMEFIQKGTVITGTQDYLLDERLTKALKKQISLKELRLNKPLLGTFELSEIGSKEGLFYVVQIPAAVPVAAATNVPALATDVVNTAVAPVAEASADKISVILIDPVKALASLAKLNATNDSNQNAFLMNSSGKILAHTLPAYVGTDLRKLDSLQSTIENLFLGAETGEITRYRTIEGNREQIAFVRVGATPFAIAVEQRALSPILSSAWVKEQVSTGSARSQLGYVFLLLAGAIALMSGISVWSNIEIRRTLAAVDAVQNTAFENNSENVKNNYEWVAPVTATYANVNTSASAQAAPQKAPQTFIEEPVVLVASSKAENLNTSEPVTFKMEENTDAADAADQFIEAQAHLQEEARISTAEAEILTETNEAKNSENKTNENNTEEPTVATVINRASGTIEFVSRISNAGTTEAIERELVDTCSKITESPTLYFRYHKRNQNLVLASAAGAVKIQNTSAMQIYVRKDIETQIENLSNQGKVASVTNYGPMAKLMISNLNIAHFEAWAVTSDRSVNANGSELIGVLVVLQAGFKSAESRPILGKMIKEAGNFLYAQNNKLRSSIYERTANERTSPSANL